MNFVLLDSNLPDVARLVANPYGVAASCRSKRTLYRLADESRAVILVACSKCEWKAAFRRVDLSTAHGDACPMPSLLEHLCASCSTTRNQP